MKSVIDFDRNEPLLEMSALDPAFATIFGLAGGSGVRRTWCKQVLAQVVVVRRNFPPGRRLAGARCPVSR